MFALSLKVSVNAEGGQDAVAGETGASQFAEKGQPSVGAPPMPGEQGVGVVSVGLGCASSYPGIYARVTNYIQWIKDNTASGDCSDTTVVTTTTPTTRY